MPRYTVKSPTSGEHFTFSWKGRGNPTEADITNIENEQQKAKASVAKFQSEDPANQSIFSPARWASMIPQGILKLGGQIEPHLPESAPLPKVGQHIQQPVLSAPEYGMFPQERDIQTQAPMAPATPQDVANLGTIKDLYENAIRPMSSNLGITTGVAAAALGPLANIASKAPEIYKTAEPVIRYGTHLIAAAMAPGTIEATKNVIQNPTPENIAAFGYQGATQALTGAGQAAVGKTPTASSMETGIIRPEPSPLLERKLLGPGEPEAVTLPKPLIAPKKTPSRETIVNNRLKTLESEALKTGDTGKLKNIMDEVGSLERELETIQGKPVEKPSEVKVSDKRTVLPTEGELAKKTVSPRIQEAEQTPVTDKRAQVNEPAPRELPTGYKGFSREKLIDERAAETPPWYQEATTPRTVAPTKSLLDKEILEKNRAKAAEEGGSRYMEKVAKGKKSNIVQEPGFEPVENGYSMKTNPDKSVVLKSPDGTKETYATAGYARARAKKGKGTQRQADLEEDHGVITGPVEREWKISSSNPNRILMTKDLIDLFEEARGEKQKSAGLTIPYLSKRSIAKIRDISPSLADHLETLRLTNAPIEITSLRRKESGKPDIGGAIETTQHEGTHGVVNVLGGLKKYFDVQEFMNHPVAKKLAQSLRARGYHPLEMPDEVFANATTGGSNRRDITPNMLGDFLRDYVDKIIDKNPKEGYRILKNMSGPVREAVIYGGNAEFTAKTGRGFAEWKRKQSRIEMRGQELADQFRKEGMSEEQIKQKIEERVYGEGQPELNQNWYGPEQRQRDISIRERTPEEARAFEERSKKFDEARHEYLLTGKWNKKLVPEGFYNAVNGITPEGKVTPTVQGSPEKGALRLQVITDVPKLAKGAWEEVISSVRNRIERQGMSGKRFDVKFERMRTNEGIIAEEWNTRFDSTVKALSKAEKDNMVDVIHGIAKPLNPKVATAVTEVRALDQEVQQRAQVHGIASQDPWATNKDMRSMHQYLFDQAKIIAKNDEFRGPNVLDNIINSSKDPKEMKNLVDYLFDNMSYVNQSKKLQPYANFAAQLEAFSKLTYFAISNIDNMATIPLHTSFKNFAKGLYESTTKEGRKFAKSTGAELEATRYEMFDIGKGKATVSNINLIPQSERQQRIVAACAGRAAAKDYFARFKANPKDKIARAQLNQLVMDPGGAGNLLSQTKLTDHQLQMAGARMAELTHGIAGKYDLPKMWTDNPYAAIPTMFKKYALVGTNNILRGIKVDPIRNIPKVLVMSQLFGEMVGDTKAAFQGMVEGAANDQDILKSALERIKNRGSWMKGQNWQKGLKPDEQEAARRIVDNLMQSWFLGMPADIAQSAAMKGETGILEFLTGPHISRLAKAGGTLVQTTAKKGIEEGVAATVKQQVRESVPLYARPFLGSAKEDREREQQQKRVRSGRVPMPKLPNISPP